MPEVTYLGARVAEVRDETPTLRTIRLDAPPGLGASYTVPGQHVLVRLPGGDAAPFAMSTAPGDPPELLVRRGAAAFELAPGDAVEVTPARGPGFPFEASRGRDVLLFATGSGIAPIRAALRSLLRERASFGAIHLFFGVRTGDELPYAGELAASEAHGVRVHRVISREGQYVQQRFRAELPDVSRAEAYLCGVPGMIDGTTAALVAAGLPRERIHLNV